MDGGDASTLGKADDAGNVQICAQRGLFLAHQIGFVRLGAEQGIGIFVGIDSHGVKAQVVAGAENAHRDLTAVGYQHLLQLCDLLHTVLLSLLMKSKLENIIHFFLRRARCKIAKISFSIDCKSGRFHKQKF